MNKFKIGVLVVVALFALFSLLFGLTWVGLEWRGFFGPKAANVERQIFEKTQSYVHGKAQALSKFRLEWHKAESPDDKSMIESTIHMQFADVDPEDIKNPDLRSFLKQMMMMGG